MVRALQKPAPNTIAESLSGPIEEAWAELKVIRQIDIEQRAAGEPRRRHCERFVSIHSAERIH
jgi:hypothetical protein